MLRQQGGRVVGGRTVGLSLLACAGALAQVCALAWRFLLLPLTHGVGVAHDHLVHPGEGLREEHCPLEEAQVASVQRQGKHHVGLLC